MILRGGVSSAPSSCVFLYRSVGTRDLVVRLNWLRGVYVRDTLSLIWRKIIQPRWPLRMSVYMLALSLAGCGEQKEMSVELMLGGNIDEFLRSSSVEISDECSSSLSLCFHAFDFPSASKELPVVSVKDGLNVLSLDHVVGLEVFNYKKRMHGRLEAIDLTLRGVPSRSDVSVAKDFTYRTIGKILAAGWIRYIRPRDPRVSGEDAKRMGECETLFGKRISSHPCFDPAYKMSDEQWRTAQSSYYWYFYKDGYYLTLKAWRSRDSNDPPREASYVFSLTFESEQENWLNSFDGDDRLRWKELLPAMLVEYKARRELMEREAELAGMTIDRSYQNPPIFALEK
jgi:hypothetical protein